MRKNNIYIIAILLISLLSGCTNTKTDIDKYLDTGSNLDEESKYLMPTLEELPTYESAKYVHTHKDMILFESDSVVLDIEYDDETYKNEKERIENDYRFYIKDDNNEKSIMNVVEDRFEINSYTFRIVVRDEENFTGIPKSFGMVGMSDVNNRIAYLYFYDFDLDAVDTESGNGVMPNFVSEYYDYEFK